MTYSEFVSWWLRNLRPGGAGPGIDACPRDGLVLRMDAEGKVLLLQRRRQREQLLARLSDGVVADDTALRVVERQRRVARDVILAASRDSVLDRCTTLPRAAEGAPDAVLRYELDRLMPFPAEAMAWGWQIESRDTRRDRLTFRVRAVPHVAVATLAAAAERLGLAPSIVEAEGPDGVAWPLPFRHRPAEERTSPPAALRGAALACGLLAAAVVAVPFWRQWTTETELDATLAALRPAATEAEMLRRRLDGDTAGADILRRERATLGSPLALIATLTDLLPDDTFLAELSIGRGQVVMRGSSASAARLMPALSADPALRAPGFIAPIRRTEDGAAEIFSLRVEYGAASP